MRKTGWQGHLQRSQLDKGWEICVATTSSRWSMFNVETCSYSHFHGLTYGFGACSIQCYPMLGLSYGCIIWEEKNKVMSKNLDMKRAGFFALQQRSHLSKEFVKFSSTTAHGTCQWHVYSNDKPAYGFIEDAIGLQWRLFVYRPEYSLERMFASMHSLRSNERIAKSTYA